MRVPDSEMSVQALRDNRHRHTQVMRRTPARAHTSCKRSVPVVGSVHPLAGDDATARPPPVSLRRLGCLLVCCLLAAPLQAAIEAVTSDGRRVRLLDDRTWEYIEEQRAAASSVRLEMIAMQSVSNTCVIDLRLHNEASYTIVSLVPQFAAFVGDGVSFQTVFVPFSNVKPTLSQHRRLRFERISCEEITSVRVQGGDRCTMDQLDKFSPTRGECLARVTVEPSTLVPFRK